MTHICVGNLTIIGSDNGLSPGRRQAIIWTNTGPLLIGPLGTKFSEILIEIQTFSIKKIHLKMSSGKWRPFCLGLNVLTDIRETGTFDDKSSNGAVPPGNKPLPAQFWPRFISPFGVTRLQWVTVKYCSYHSKTASDYVSSQQWGAQAACNRYQVHNPIKKNRAKQKLRPINCYLIKPNDIVGRHSINHYYTVTW